MYALLFAVGVTLAPADAGWLRYNNLSNWLQYNHLPARGGGWASESAPYPQPGGRFVKQIGVVFKYPAAAAPVLVFKLPDPSPVKQPAWDQSYVTRCYCATHPGGANRWHLSRAPRSTQAIYWIDPNTTPLHLDRVRVL